MLVLDGPPERIREATRAVHREACASLKGYIVQDGANIPPDTPPEHINAMMEAAETLRPVLSRARLANSLKLCQCQLIHDCIQ